MTTRTALAALSAALALAACDRTETVPRAIAAGGTPTGCATCHGDPARVSTDPLVRAAPPLGPTDTTGGAHLAHLVDGTFRAPLACDECHDVPATAEHVDGAVAVPMALLARTRDAAPAWDASSATCSGVYCHGAGVGGGPAATPAWSSGATLGCASCHGYPPPSHEVTATACADCHARTVLPGGALDLASGHHLDGRRDLSGMHAEGYADPKLHGPDANTTGLAGCGECHGADLAGGDVGVSCNACHADHGFAAWATTCTFCHGDVATGRASPPLDTRGRNVATNVSVGVHAAHVGTTIATPLACTECHPDRAGSNVVTDAAHVDGNGVAEVELGALAKTGGASASYVRASATSATCASTYCHGRFTGGGNGGAGATVGWTSTTQATCSSTSCHAWPPPTGRDSHHSGIACWECHGHDGSGAAHVNGVEDVKLVDGSKGGAAVGAWSSSTRKCGSLTCHGKGHDSGWIW